MGVIEINSHMPASPWILVGTKQDLRGDEETISKLAANGQKPISTEEARELSKELMAYKYLECSALTQNGLKQVFDDAIRCALADDSRPGGSGGKKKKNKCSIL